MTLPGRPAALRGPPANVRARMSAAPSIIVLQAFPVYLVWEFTRRFIIAASCAFFAARDSSLNWNTEWSTYYSSLVGDVGECRDRILLANRLAT